MTGLLAAFDAGLLVAAGIQSFTWHLSRRVTRRTDRRET